MRILPYGAIVGAIAMMASTQAVADDVFCPPHLVDASVDGNVIVGGACSIINSTVDDNVHVEDEGSLTTSNASIGGSVQAEGSESVLLTSTNVGGDVQLDNLIGAASGIVNSRVGGSVQFNDNDVPLQAVNSVIGGDLQAFQNSGGVNATDNTIGGNLQCKENDPAPVGSGNVVDGNKEDQCAANLGF